MSSGMPIASRLLQVRNRLGYPQSKMAAALGIADRTYKNYEVGEREIPLSTALNFCKTFEIDLNWLVAGKASLNHEEAIRIFESCVSEMLSQLERRRISIPSIDVSTDRIAKACAYLANQCIEKGTRPEDEVNAVMELIL